MKRMKKLFAILMTMAMVMGLGITGFAAPSPGSDGKYGTTDDRGTIAVSGVEKGVTVTAYQIIKAKYENAGGQFSGYEVLYVTDPAISIPTEGTAGNLPEVTISQGQMDQLEKMDLGTGETMIWDDVTRTYKADVAPGTYLVRVTDSETHIYNTMVVSVYYETNGLDETVLEVTKPSAKKIDNPTIEKKVDEKDGNSAEIEDIVTYTITVDPIPHYSGSYPVFNVVDTLSAGLTYNNDLKVTINNTEFNNYESSFDNQSNALTIDFVTKEDGYTLNGYTGQSMVITYTATVNNNAVVNENPNSNDATLNYTHDSKVENEDDYVKDKTYTYTFEIDGDVSGTTDIIDKVGNKIEDKDGLNGAQFSLYKVNPDEDTDAQPFKTATTATVGGKKGQMTFTGLEAGTTYYLKEINAPEGYSLNTKVYTVLIEATYYGEADSVSKEDYGKLKSWVVKIDGTQVANFSVNNNATVKDSTITGIDIMNTTLTALPSTGGMGTTLFTIAGCVIMISAAGLFFATRKKAN